MSEIVNIDNGELDNLIARKVWEMKREVGIFALNVRVRLGGKVRIVRITREGTALFWT
jgi:hypothetical protein